MVDITKPITLCVADLQDIAKLISATVREDLSQEIKEIKAELVKEQEITLKLNGLNLVQESDNVKMFALLRHLATEETTVRALIRNAKDREYLNLEDSKVRRGLFYKYATAGLLALVIAGVVTWVKSL